MLFKLALLALCALVFSVPTKRAVSQTTAIFATGTGLHPTPIFYADGYAYIGFHAPSWANSSANITFSSSDSIDEPWVINANGTANTTISGQNLYIIPEELSAVGFVPPNSTLPDGAVITGFMWYGGAVSYVTDDDELLASFWALPTNTTGVWALVWNPDVEDDGDAIPVYLLQAP